MRSRKPSSSLHGRPSFVPSWPGCTPGRSRTEALETAEAALQQDPDNHEANKILGSVYAALSEQRQAFRPGDDPARTGPGPWTHSKRAGATPGWTSISN